MSGVDEEDMAFPRPRRNQRRFQVFFDEFRLSGDVFVNRFFRRQRNGPLPTPLQAKSFFRNWRTWVGPRFSPVNS